MSPVRVKRCAGPCARDLIVSPENYWRDAKQTDGFMNRCKDCVMESRQQRAERRANGEVVPTITAEEREKRRQRMLQLHAEGRAGGSEFGKLGGRTRKPRITDALLEWARTDPIINLQVRAIEASLRSKVKSQRMRAVEFLSKLEQDEDKLKAAARGAGKGPDEMSAEELEEFVAQGLAAMIERGELGAGALSDITLEPEQYRELA